MARRTMDEIMISRADIDPSKIAATTEAEIRQHMIEDGEDPDAPPTGYVLRRPGQRGPGRRAAKVQLTLRIDPAALARWKASGDGWMSRAAHLLAKEAPGQD